MMRRKEEDVRMYMSMVRESADIEVCLVERVEDFQGVLQTNNSVEDGMNEEIEVGNYTMINMSQKILYSDSLR